MTCISNNPGSVFTSVPKQSWSWISCGIKSSLASVKQFSFCSIGESHQCVCRFRSCSKSISLSSPGPELSRYHTPIINAGCCVRCQFIIDSSRNLCLNIRRRILQKSGRQIFPDNVITSSNITISIILKHLHRQYLWEPVLLSNQQEMIGHWCYNSLLQKLEARSIGSAVVTLPFSMIIVFQSSA